MLHYRSNDCRVSIAQSKITAQGQISVPAAIRKRLGLGPGSVIEWEERGDQIVVRKAGRYSNADIHRVLFGVEEPQPGLDVKAGIRKHLRKKHARG
jgi:AbrB family looped-hinge helix DNA binding protein